MSKYIYIRFRGRRQGAECPQRFFNTGLYVQVKGTVAPDFVKSFKFYSKMNLQLNNIIGDTFTKLADFFPFVSGFPRKVWTNHKLFSNLSIRLGDSRNLHEFLYVTLNKLKLGIYILSKEQQKNLKALPIPDV